MWCYCGTSFFWARARASFCWWKWREWFQTKNCFGGKWREPLIDIGIYINQKCTESSTSSYCIRLFWPALKRFLLYVRRSEIRGVDIDNPYMNVMTALTVPDIDDVTVVDYDALEERIYWADVKTQTIKRAFINGTQLETIISAGRRTQGLHTKWAVCRIFC